MLKEKNIQLEKKLANQDINAKQLKMLEEKNIELEKQLANHAVQKVSENPVKDGLDPVEVIVAALQVSNGDAFKLIVVNKCLF